MQDQTLNAIRRRNAATRVALEAIVFAGLLAVTVQHAIWFKTSAPDARQGPALAAVDRVQTAGLPASAVQAPAPVAPPVTPPVAPPVAAEPAPAPVLAQPAPAPRAVAALPEAPRSTSGRIGIPRPLSRSATARLDPAIMPAPAPKPTAAEARRVAHKDNVRYFDGRPVRPVRQMWMTVTAYSPDHRSCGDSADGVTASNKSVWTNGMRMVAADPKVLRMGSLITVPGYAENDVVPVLDVGGAIKGKRLDVLYPTHEVARQWGVRRVLVTVWEYADEPARAARAR